MSPEKQRTVIAEHLGWTHLDHGNVQYTARRPDGKWDLIPDYCNDLNAMHEAEKVLYTNPDYVQIHAFNNFAYRLIDVCRHQCNAVHATSAQRAEALLRTIGKWEDDQ